MFKITLKVILTISLLISNIEQSYALRPMAASVDNRGMSHSIFSPKLHRKAEQKVGRIKRLLADIDRLLKEKNLTLQVNLADFRHAYKYSLPVSWDKSAIIRSADLVTLELPDVSVRPYREGKGKLAHSDNPFWQDALDKLSTMNLAGPFYGVSAAEIRYYITRMVAYLGIPLTLERGEPVFVLMDKNTKYNLQELGGTESKSISYEQLLAALTNRQRAELEKKRVLNLKENQNPFGEKYLLLYYPPDRDIIGLMGDVLEIFSPLFEEYFIEYDEQLEFIFKNLIVRVLTVQNDFWQAELALTKIKQLLESRERNDSKRSVAFSYVHIGGAVHGGSLEEYWRLSKSRRIKVRHCIDRRVPIPHYSRRSPIQDYDLEEILSLTWFDSKHKRLVFGRQRLFEFFNTMISSNQEYFNRILVAEFASQMANTMKGFVTKRKEVVEKETPVDLAVTYYLDHKIKFILSYIPFEQLICFLKEGSGFDYRDLLAFCILYPEDSRFMFSKKTVDLPHYIPEEASDYLNCCEPAKEAGAEPFYLQPFLAVTDRNDKMLPVTSAPAEGVSETKNIKSSSAGTSMNEKVDSPDALLVIKKIYPPEHKVNSALDLSKEKTILVYGGLGNLQTYLGIGFDGIKKFFPNVRFIAADIKDPKSEKRFIRERMKKINLPWREDNDYFVSPKDYQVKDWLLKDRAGNSLPIDDNGVISLHNGQKIKIDGVITAVPTYLHLPIAQLWAKKGVSVWVEKPIVMPNKEEMEAIWKLARTYQDKIFTVDFYRDSDALIWLLKESNLLDKIGDIKSIRGRGVENWPLNPDIRKWLWQPEKSGGGLGIDMALHSLVAMAMVLGKKEIESAYAKIEDVFLGRYEKAPGADEVETYFWMHAKVANIDLYVDSGNAADTTYSGITIVGEKGEIEVFIGTGEYAPYVRYTDKTKPENPTTIYLFEKSRFAYTNTFVEFLSLIYGRPNINDLVQRVRLTISSLEIIKKAYEFAKANRILPVTHKVGKLPEGVSKVSLGKIFPGLPKTGQAIFKKTVLKSSSAGGQATEKPSALPEYTIPTIEALEKAEGNRTIAAGILKKDVRTVSRRIKAIREATDKIDTAESRDIRKRLEKALKGKMAGKRSLVMPKFTKPMIRALEKAKGNKPQAAIILDIKPGSIYGRIKSIKEALEKLGTPESKKLLDRLNRALAGEMAGKYLFKAKERKPEKPFVLRRYEDETIEALKKAKGSRVTAAKILDITPDALRVRRKALEKAADEAGTPEARAVIRRLKKALAGEMAGKKSKEVLEREKKKRLKLPEDTYKVIKALEKKKGNQTAAARSLGIGLSSLQWKISRIRKIASEIDTPKSRSILKRLENALAGKWAHKQTLGLPEYTIPTIEALEYFKGSKVLAAKYLGISPGGMTQRINRIEKAATVIDTSKSRAVLKRLRNALAGEWAGKRLSTLPSARAGPGQGKARTKNIRSSAAGSTPNKNPFLAEQPLIKGNAINVFELEKLFNNAISKFSGASVAIWGSFRYMADSDGYMVISDKGKRKIRDLDMMYSLGGEKFFLKKKFATEFAQAINQQIKGMGYSERLRFVFEEKARCSYLHFSLTGDKKKGEKAILGIGIHGFDESNPGYHVFTSLTGGFDHIFQIISCLCLDGNLRELKNINKKTIPKIISWYLSVAYFFGLPKNYENIREEWANIRTMEQECRDFSLPGGKKAYASYLALAKKIMKDKEFAALRDYVEANLKESGPLMRTIEAKLNIQIIPPELDPQGTIWRVVYPTDNLAHQTGAYIIYTLPKEITVNNQRLRMVPLTPELMLGKVNEFFTLQKSVAADMAWDKKRDVIDVAKGGKDGPIQFDPKLNCSFTVLDENDVPVAVAMYSSVDERKDYVYLETLAVLPGYHGTGVASWILLHSFQEAKRQYFTHAAWNIREELDETEKADPFQKYSARGIPYYEKRVKAERDEKKYKNGRIPPKEQTMDVTKLKWEVKPGKWHIAYHKDLSDLSSLYADFQAKSVLPQKLIAVIGASGFLGKKVYVTFKRIHTDVVGTSYTTEGFYHLDVTDEEEVKTFFEQFHPDVVIYAAGETDVDRAERNPFRAMALNADALDLISRYFKGHFIYISTDYVFDGRKAPYTPDAPCNPLNEYGESKMHGEKKALSNFKKATIIRLSILYGYNDEQDKDTFLKQIVKKMAQGEEIIVDNQQIKHPTWLDDVVRLIVAIVQEGASGIFQLNGTEAMRRDDWAKLIASVYQSVYPASTIGPIKGKFIKGFVPRPHNAELVNTSVPTSLETGTEQTIRSMSALIELFKQEKTEAEIRAQA